MLRVNFKPTDVSAYRHINGSPGNEVPTYSRFKDTMSVEGTGLITQTMCC